MSTITHKLLVSLISITLIICCTGPAPNPVPDLVGGTWQLHHPKWEEYYYEFYRDGRCVSWYAEGKFGDKSTWYGTWEQTGRVLNLYERSTVLRLPNTPYTEHWGCVYIGRRDGELIYQLGAIDTREMKFTRVR